MRRLVIAAAILAFAVTAGARDYDLAINHGRVIDPETGLDAVRHVGIAGGAIAKISKKPLKAATVIDATGRSSLRVSSTATPIRWGMLSSAHARPTA